MSNANDDNFADNEQLWDLLEHAHATMERIDQHIDEHNEAGLKRREFTNLLIRGITIFLAILVVINLYLLNDLDNSMRNIVQSMDHMTTHFATVSDQMVQVTGHTDGIRQHMDRLPAIQTSLYSTTQEMAGMDRSVGKIDRNLGDTTYYLTGIDGQMGELSGRLYDLGQNVNVIRHDMHDISKPARWMDWMTP